MTLLNTFLFFRGSGKEFTPFAEFVVFFSILGGRKKRKNPKEKWKKKPFFEPLGAVHIFRNTVGVGGVGGFVTVCYGLLRGGGVGVRTLVT